MICPSVPEMPYGEFSRRIHEQAYASRIPLNGTLELTYRCNCNCLHCYCNLPADHKSANSKELSTQEVFRIIDQIVEEGCLWLLLTGGECLLRHDFVDIWRHAKQKGLLLTLFTNGTLISREIAEFLKRWPPFSVEVSLYGASSRIHDKVTRTPGSYDKCMKGIENLFRCNIPLKLKTMVLKDNVHELFEMKKMAREFGADFRFDALINGRIDTENSPCPSRLSPKEVVRLDLEDEERWKAWLEFSRKTDSDMSHELFSCGAGRTSFSVNPEGKLQPCGLISSPNWDLRDVSFVEGWQQVPRIRLHKPSSDFRCNTCKSYALCGQCPGWAMTEHQRFDIPVDYLCQITHELIKVLPDPDREENIQNMRL